MFLKISPNTQENIYAGVFFNKVAGLRSATPVNFPTKRAVDFTKKGHNSSIAINRTNANYQKGS